MQVPNPEITFTLTAEDLDWVLRAANVLSSPQIAVESDGTKINLVTLDTTNDSAHTDCLELGWKPMVSFEEGIKKTVSWFLNKEAE